MSLAALVLSAPIFLISFVVSSFCSEMSLKIRLVCVVDSLFARFAPNCLHSLVVGFKFSLIWEQIVHCFGGHFLFLSFIAAIFRRRWYLLLPSLAVLLVFFLHFLSDLSGNKIYVQYKKQISVTSQEELHYINSFVNSAKNGIMRGHEHTVRVGPKIGLFGLFSEGGGSNLGGWRKIPWKSDFL